MQGLSIEPAPHFAKLGAINCVVVPDGLHGVSAEEVWEMAKAHQAIIPSTPNVEGDVNNGVVVRFGGAQQRAYGRKQLLSRLHCNNFEGE